MAKNHTFVRTDVFPSWWANAIQEFLGTVVSGLEVRKLTDTSVEVPASTFDDQVSVGIDGKWRYRTSQVTRSHPGGAAGTYPIFAVCKEESIISTPLPFTDATDYSFDLRVEAPGATPTIVAGTVDFYRQIGEAEWDGTKITRVNQTAGQRSKIPISPQARRTDEIPARIRGMAGQVANLWQAEDNLGAVRASVSPAGKLYVLDEVEIDGPLNHDGSTAGFFGVAPAARPGATAEIKAALASLGLLTDGGATPLDLDGGALTVGALTSAALTATGNVRLGDADADTLGFFSVAGVARQGATADIKDALAAYGLLTNGGASPLNLDGGALTAGAATVAALTATGNVRLGDADADTVGFFSVAGAARSAATADIKDALASYGLLTNGGASPLDLDGGTLTAGEVRSATDFFSRFGNATDQVFTGLIAAGQAGIAMGSAFDTKVYRDGAGNLYIKSKPAQSLLLGASGDILGFYGGAGAAQEGGWGVPNSGGLIGPANRTPLGEATTLQELKRYVATLAQRLKNLGLIGA